MLTVRLPRLVLVLFVGFGICSGSALAQLTWYVDDDALPGGNGQGWDTAFDDLQSALFFSSAGDEIRVAGGVYRPSVQTEAGVPRTETFLLIEGVTLSGGYAGLADLAAPDTYDPIAYVTVLSGDLNGDDGPAGNDIENCYHVVTADGLTDATVLDGCTITGGNAQAGLPHAYGGGLYVIGGAPVVTNCVFVRNKAYHGGAVYATGADVLLISCAFWGNNALIGGGVLAREMSHPSLYNCRFAGNSALYGGALCNYIDCGVLLGNCSFVGNEAYYGGAIYNYDQSDAELVNCILWANASDELNRDDSSTEFVVYSVVSGGWEGEGDLGDDPMWTRLPDPGADNVWGTIDDDYGDLHLVAGSPCIDAGDNRGVPDFISTDCAGNVRFMDEPNVDDTGFGDPPIVDIGAYEFVDCNGNERADDLDLSGGFSPDCNGNRVPDECDIASGFSLDENGNGIPDECEAEPCPGDFDNSGVRDLADLARLLGHYGQAGVGYPEGDLDGDGDVDLADLAILLGLYGDPC